jgi:hypothetical protein
MSDGPCIIEIGRIAIDFTRAFKRAGMERGREMPLQPCPGRQGKRTRDAARGLTTDVATPSERVPPQDWQTIRSGLALLADRDLLPVNELGTVVIIQT